MATCLANARCVPKGILDRAVAALGHIGITDIITLMGFYTSVAMSSPPMHREWPLKHRKKNCDTACAGTPAQCGFRHNQTRHLSLHEPQESMAHPVGADDDPRWSTVPPPLPNFSSDRVRRVSRRNFRHRLLQVGSRTGALI